MSAAPYWVYQMIPLGVNPLLQPNLEFAVLAGRSAPFSDVAGLVPAVPGGPVRKWLDLTTFHQDVTLSAFSVSAPLLGGNTPNANHPTVSFSSDPAQKQQLQWPSVGRFPTNARGYTCYMWFNSRTVDTVAFPGQSVFDVTLGFGFRFDQQYPTLAPPNITALEYTPGSFGLTVPSLGWQLWRFTAAPPVNGGPMRIFKNGVRVGPTSGTYGPIVDTVWNMSLEARFLISGNPAQNIPFLGDVGGILLYSDNHSPVLAAGIEQWIRGNV